MSSRINLEVAFVTFHDDNFLGSNVVDRNPATFVLTTGGFPHEITVNTRASSAKFSKITLTLDDVKDIVLEKKGIDEADYQIIAERTLQRGGGDEKRGKRTQVEVLEFDPEQAGKNIRHLRLRILSGYSDFAGIYNIDAYGEESLQQLAVLESKPEVNL
ncbi:Placental protein 25 (PP25) [Angomonas deanei]|uniref:Uncharacterized protein n=1 Tax=Angomonas deanei TaxID=59799 RepID=S9UX83_9TRYP|nr:Placental protein 25 (PP25) [Angomonas deanei]EPY35507.1 Placental protein 25 (PP25) [Angomonas deanei]EPY43071.1 Placental protein 25 (PP25) [Angomonas deanei]CAD2220438.1 hypothetical protein, conserved [Angomonas deanei]|eukprot:EPY32413.1 Placental protein 25 (PP25) [Angomonas deanei]